MRQIELMTRKWHGILRKLLDLTKSPSANCLFASKDHVRPVSKRLCIIFMASSCPNFVLGRLKKKKRKKKMEKIAVFLFSVNNSSGVFYAICECYWVHSDSYTMVRDLKSLKS